MAKKWNNLLTYGLVGVGGFVVGGIAALYFIGFPMFKIMLAETIQLCPSCNQDVHGDKCKSCAEAVFKKAQAQFGFGLY